MTLSPNQFARASLIVKTGETRLAIIDRLRTARDTDVSVHRRYEAVNEAQRLIAEGKRYASMLGTVRAAALEPKRLTTATGDDAAHRADVLLRLPEHIAAAEREASEAIKRANKVETRAAERRSLNQEAAEKLALAKSLKELKAKLEVAK